MFGLLDINTIAGPFSSLVESTDGISVYEKMKSRPLALGSSNTYQREYIVTGTDDENMALNAIYLALSICPEFVTIVDTKGRPITFARGSGKVHPILNGYPPTMWEGTIDYTPVAQAGEPYIDGDSFTSFSIGAQDVLVKQAISEIGRYPSAGDDAAPALGGLIGLTADGQVQGVNIRVPTFRFSKTVYKPDSEVTDAYIAALYAVAKAPVNAQTFLDFDAGEVLFLGVTGTRRNRRSGWEMTFDFAGEPNSTNAAPESGLSGIVKKGWEYLWFTYVPVTKTVGTREYLVQKVQFAYVDKVYNTSNFSLLEIPA